MPGPLFPLIYGTRYTNTQIPSQAGKTIIVTGGNTGLGYETVKQLSRTGAHVYLAARSEEKARQAIDRIKAELGDRQVGQIDFLSLDLQDLEATRKAAKIFSDREDRLDVLVNNAGVMAMPYKLTKDGIEQQIQTNHVAPYLFTRLLIPKLQAAPAPRIVTVSSRAHEGYKHHAKAFDSLENLNDELGGPWPRYNKSKIANVLFTMKLKTEYPGILSNACHPGIIYSDLWRDLKVLKVVLATVSKTGAFLNCEQGALTQLYLATAREIEEKKISGAYYQPIALPKKPSTLANMDSAERLWATTEEILRQKGFSMSL